MSTQSRHSARTVATHRSAKALAFGARKVVLITRMPSVRNTSSNGPENLASRSWIKNPASRSGRFMTRFRACWVTQAAGGRDQVADICVEKPVPEAALGDIDLWTG